jgi:glycosyltransferase involved in cell wall biosynthesis
MKMNALAYRYIKEDGYGRFALSLIRALVRAGVDIWPGTVDFLELPGWMQRLAGFDTSRLTLSIMPPNHLVPIAGRQVNLCMYEALSLPEGWGAHVNEKAERLIVPADFLVDVFRREGTRVPIHVVPGGVDIEEFPVLCNGNHVERPFVFGALGDRSPRKGDDIAWSAFYRAFGDSGDVRLVVKCRRGGKQNIDLSNSDPRVSIWREDSPTLADFFAQIDCFCFPTRGEGWGLPPREAASMGLPVICTEWSGTADCASWAIPIRTYTLHESQLIGEGEWAVPDVDEVAAHMTYVYEHRDEARQKGLQAAAWLRANQTWDDSARKLLDVFKEFV